MGKTVAMVGGAMCAQFRCIKASQCLVLPKGTTPAEGASCFVNPLTALGMVETMRREGHSALVHQKSELEKTARSRTAPAREVERAGMILRQAGGESSSAIKNAVRVSKPTMYKCIDKTLAMGTERGLKDLPHSPKQPVITEEARPG